MREPSKIVALGFCSLLSSMAGASVLGSNIPAESVITDGKSNSWTVNQGVVFENGKPAGYTKNVTRLLYSNGLIYQENAAAGWWSWDNGYWVYSSDPRVVSAAGTTIPAVAQIVDRSAKNVWSVAGGRVYENGIAAGYTANVKMLLYFGGTIYQQNSASRWWSWNGGGWTASADPRSADIGAGSATTRIVDGASNIWTLASGVVYENGSHAGFSAKVTQLRMSNGVIYQENSAGGWWSWNGSGWTASASPQGQPPSIATPASVTAVSALSKSIAAVTASPAATAAAAPVVTPAATVAGYPSYRGKFGVQVAGNKLVSTQTGAVVPMIGANVSGLEGGVLAMWPQFSAASSADWAIVKSWGHGVNTVRLPLNETSWLNYQCEDPGTGVSGRYAYIGQSASGHGLYQPDPKGVYKQTVITAVANATAAGLYVILDLHWGAPNGVDGVGICPIGQPGFADADHSLAFWKDIADTFKNNPAVVFELFNEPYGDNDFNGFVGSVNGGNNNQVEWEGKLMRDGGSLSPFVAQNNANGNAPVEFNFSYDVAGMQAMVDTIRGEYAGNVILTAPVWWAGQIQLWTQTQPTDPHGQLAASWHAYGWTGSNSGHDGPMSVLNAGFPIVVTEQWNVNGVSGGYSWLLSQGISFLWWGMNDWNGQSLAAEFTGNSPWFDTADQATAPNY